MAAACAGLHHSRIGHKYFPSLRMVTSLVERLRWTVVVPLPAIMELVGLALNAGPLGEVAKAAVAFVVSHVRSHADLRKSPNVTW